MQPGARGRCRLTPRCGGTYRHFASKKAVLEAAIDRLLEDSEMAISPEERSPEQAAADAQRPTFCDPTVAPRPVKRPLQFELTGEQQTPMGFTVDPVGSFSGAGHRVGQSPEDPGVQLGVVASRTADAPARYRLPMRPIWPAVTRRQCDQLKWYSPCCVELTASIRFCASSGEM